MQIGYARVTTQDQDLRLQHEALRQVPCDKIYEDKASGTKASREGLKLVFDVLRENDTLVVWKLDRLGCSVRDLVNIVSGLEQRGVHFKSLTDQIDTSTTAGRFFFSCDGQPGADGKGPDGGTDQGRTGSGTTAGTNRGS